jgi:hypothetical protein
MQELRTYVVDADPHDPRSIVAEARTVVGFERTAGRTRSTYGGVMLAAAQDTCRRMGLPRSAPMGT